MPNSATDWINALELKPHPEGGFYRETFRASETLMAPALPSRFEGTRALASTILYLLPGTCVSRLHRLRTDEVWYYHAGSAVALHGFHPDTGYRRVSLGIDLERHQQPQAVMPASWWFGATVDDTASFALVGCSLAPGFDFADFELSDGIALQQKWSEHVEILARLTRPADTKP